ncbi:hypothetical protein ACJJTC_001613 [Scirpophaga incertulas]
MWLLRLHVLLLLVLYSEADFGAPHLKSSRLCAPWSCVNTKLGLPTQLPPRENYSRVLKSLLPVEWHQSVDKAMEICYGSRPRDYVTTCPGQALLHCTLDNLIQNCPEEHLRKDDACYPIYTIAGLNNMFSQSRYQDLEKNLPKERRPAWFMRQYFNSKCCNIPNFINPSLMEECGFQTFIRYDDHKPSEGNPNILDTNKKTSKQEDKPVVVMFEDQDSQDPLDCCDMEGFIAPTWREECEFYLRWGGQERLLIEENIVTPTTNAPETTPARDIKIVPLSCEKETCIFKTLNVISESGVVDIEAFSKLLDNFTLIHPSWRKAKGRVITQCLKGVEYAADCEINRLLGCTLDVLSENCPDKAKHDVCRHSKRNHTLCQISSSKYRPKNRRSVCSIPELVGSEVLASCGVTGVSHMEYVPEPVKMSKSGWRDTSKCQDSTPSTICLMKKMDVLNKYNFTDYFKMKERIRNFASSHSDRSILMDMYLNSYIEMPMYHRHCSSPKKLLNVIDTMLMTCPSAHRKDSPHCKRFFNEIVTTAPTDFRNVTLRQLNLLIKMVTRPKNIATPKPVVYNIVNPEYDYGILKSDDVPPIQTIPVHSPITKVPVNRSETVVRLPAYIRFRNDLEQGTSKLGGLKDGVFKSTQFLMHGRLSMENSTSN